MNKHFKTKKKQFHIFLCLCLSILLIALSIPFSVKTFAATPKYLFIGNSMTFFNNVPSMFQQMTSAGKSITIDYTAAVYGGRTLQEHANAIATVKSTQGQEKNLTSTTKKYFYNSSSSSTYSSTVFNSYVSAVWNTSTNKPKSYDYIVLQMYWKNGNGDVTADEIYQAAKTIISTFNSPSTTFIINATWPKYNTTLSSIEKKQDTIDSAVNGAIQKLKADASVNQKFKKLIPVYSGRALTNFLFYTGEDRVQTIESAAYDVYGDTGVVNDVAYGDNVHTTQLGSYIETACLYAAIYGDAQSTAKKYVAASTTQLKKVNGTYGENFAMQYNSGKGFKSNLITQQATFIADATQSGMHLNSVSDADAWKADSTKKNYNRLNLITISFDGNGATTNNYKKQTYEYGKTGQKFVGTATKTGYILSGWADDKNAEEPVYKPNSSVSNSWINKTIQNYSGNRTVYAVWTPEKITITFNGNGATENTFKKQIYEYGKSGQKFVGEISKTGYIFDGWSLKSNATNGTWQKNAGVTSSWITTRYNDPNAGPSFTLYAIWKPETVQVTHNLNTTASSYSSFGTVTYTYGVANQTFAPGSFGAAGKKILGWSDTKNATEPKWKVKQTVNDSWITKIYNSSEYKGKITIYAVWENMPNKTITLNKQSGTGGTSSVTAVYDNTLPNITVPTRTGYTFGGYYTATNGGGTQYYNDKGVSVVSRVKLTSNLTLYAKWTANQYNVTLNQQNGSGGSGSITATYGSAMPKITVPTRTGYTFGGYYTASNGSGTQYYKADGTSARNSDFTKATTLYAKWTANSYTITLDNQNGSGGTTSVSATYGSAMPKITIPTKTGYTFGGYYTAANGSGIKYYNADGTSAKSADFTKAAKLYANWTANSYAVTLNKQGGSGGTSSITATYGSAMPKITTPVRTGYVFDGYYTTANGGGTKYYKADGTSAKKCDLTKATTLYAKWISAILYGDANNDGLIDSDDAMMVLQYYAGIINQNQINLMNADVNGDGVVDSDDAMLILQYYAGLITRFPV